MQLVRYNPLHDLEKDLDRLWSSEWNLPVFTDIAPMDIYEEGGKLVAEVSLPNFNKEDIKVTADQGFLEVSAGHEEKNEDQDKRHYYMRESSSYYLRRVSLPEGVKAEDTEAEFKNGVLRITMPKETKKETRRVTVK